MKELKDMSLEELWQLFPIILKEHNVDYINWYNEEQKNLSELLQDFDICRINHIGSTAVSGLVAKPIVDILLELPEAYSIDAISALLTANGWILMNTNHKEKILVFNKGYTQNGFAEKVFHLHIRPAGDWGELYFRDYLREYPAAARKYEYLKWTLLAKYENNRDGYTAAKSEFIAENTKKARDVFPRRYLPANH